MTAMIELVFDQSCPHVDAARRQLREALTRVGRLPVWTEWDRNAPNTPAYVRRCASPSVLVGGRDVSQGVPLDGGCGCRIYYDAKGRRVEAPTVQMILAALTAAEETWE